MNEGNNPRSEKDFDERLRRARGSNVGTDQGGQSAENESGKGLAMRIGAELVVAVAVGGGIGFMLDRWLGTGPWLLIGFLLLGNAAGVWNVFRMTNNQGYAAGFRQNKRPLDDDEAEDP